MMAYIVLFIIIAILGGTVIAFVRHAIAEGKDEPEYYTPSENLKNAKIEMDDNREEMEKIENEKSNNATDCSNRLNNLDIR